MNLIKKILLIIVYLTVENLLSISYCADNSKNDTLAIVGKKVITEGEFVASYKEKIRTVGLTDNGETRNGFLMNLVSDQLLIIEARKEGLDRTNTAKKEFKRIRLQELLNAYSLKHISPAINITENDLEDLFAKFNTWIKVSHIYAPTKRKADSLYKELVNGKKFEDLAKQNFEDPELRNNGGSLGYISIDETDPDFEKTAYSMEIGEISRPVKTVEGYSIIRVEDIKSNPLLTENEFYKAHDKLIAFARKRAYEEAAKQFSKALDKKLKVKLNDKIVTKIFEELQGKTIENFSETPSDIFKEDLNKTAVFSELRNWDLQTLINEMSFVSDKQRKFIRTKENLEDIIKGLVNRKYIEQEAVKEKLDKTLTFYKNVEYNFDSYLLTTLENRQKSKIQIPPDSLRFYYTKNINQFKTEMMVRLSSILVDNSFLADSIEHLLKENVPFEKLSKKYSVQTLTAENGGDMGYFKKSELDDLADKVFSLKEGQWEGPFFRYSKYVFIKCTEVKESVTKSFEESKDEIEKTLVSFKWLEVKDKYIESLKSEISYQLFPQKLHEIKF